MYVFLHSPNSQVECQNPWESLHFPSPLCMLSAMPTPTFSLPCSGTTGPLDSGFTHFSQHPRPGPLAPLNAPSGFASELFGGVARAGAHLENL